MEQSDAFERAAWLRLLLTPGIGPRTARELLTRFGLPTAIFSASAMQLRAHVDATIANTLCAPPTEDIERASAATEQWLAGGETRALMTLADADYPPLLLAITDPPPVLFIEGRRALLAQPSLAIVGSRNPTQQGAANAQAFARSLAHAGLTIVSGLALGIDAAAHRGALAAAQEGSGASTIAVIGTGIDIDYPASNRALAKDLRMHGLVISELPLGAAPVPHNFPRRNRIIAGLARGVLVVEAAVHSGSLITARLAAETGREVLAIPGSIHSTMAKGCHRLIKDGAKLVESAQDVLDELKWGATAATTNAAQRGTNTERSADLPADQQRLLELLGHDPVDLDTLATRSGRATGELTADLFSLELAQHVERLPGNRYQRLR